MTAQFAVKWSKREAIGKRVYGVNIERHGTITEVLGTRVVTVRWKFNGMEEVCRLDTLRTGELGAISVYKEREE